MLSQNALNRAARIPFKSLLHASLVWRRLVHHDGHDRLSAFWTPTQRSPPDNGQAESGHDLLVRAGFLRQAHSGIFHLLPLGLRVQDKIERLIDQHMRRLGASKVSLSSLSTEELWQQSGRLDKGRPSELLRLEDRKGAKYLLSPTHEEEITTIVADAIHSYKELPLRLYQVSRKYRDEPRPRQGLLRGREFVMKDLYTFDATEAQARETYEDVRKAYVDLFADLGLPFFVARADSGNMGGTLSHEFHFASEQGEDTVITCSVCRYSINEELYVGHYNGQPVSSDEVEVAMYVSKDRIRLCAAYYPAHADEPNINAIKAIFPEVDSTLHGAAAESAFDKARGSKTIVFVDPRLSQKALKDSLKADAYKDMKTTKLDGEEVLLTKAREGDACPNCDKGELKLQQAVEIGHTFHLGQRYSIPFAAQILDAENKKVNIEMGCHGIGVSRLIGAVAALLKDSKGLNWPLSISPFSTVIVPAPKIDAVDVEEMYDLLGRSAIGDGENVDVAIDDRERPLGWKLNDADLVGYPFIVVLGNGWKEGRRVELQCRQLGVKEEVEKGYLLRRMVELKSQMRKRYISSASI